MKRFLVGFFILMLVLGSTCLFSKVQVGEEVLERIETQHPYAGYPFRSPSTAGGR